LNPLNSPQGRFVLRVIAAAIAAAASSPLDTGWQGAVAAAVYAVLGLLGPHEPKVGVNKRDV